MNKNNRKLLPAVIAAAVVLLVMCGTGSAGHIGVSKTTVPPGAEYRIGDTIVYSMSVQVLGTAPPGYSFTVDVYDTYPDGTVEQLDAGLTLTKNGVTVEYYTRTYVVTAADVAAGETLNKIHATGTDSDDDNVYASTDYTSDMLDDPVADFDFDAGDCDLTVEFTPTAYDPDGTIATYEWDFENDGITDKTTSSDSSFSHTFPASGNYDVNLTVTDNDGLMDWIVKTVHITAPPTVSLTASPTSVIVPPGGWVTVTGTVVDPDGDNLDYTWTIVNATGTHVIPGGSPIVGPYPKTISIPCFVDKVPTTVTLTVEDPVGCVASKDVRLGRPPQEDVPILTPAGAFALIGMLCIAGAGRILTKGRRS